MTEILTSRKNPEIQLARILGKKRQRDEQKLFLIEGYRELYKAVSQNIRIKTAFYAPSYFLKDNETTLLEKIHQSDARVQEISPSLFASLSYRDRPDGLLAIAYQPERSLQDLSPTEQSIYVIAEGFEKPGNLGTLLRTMDAVKADGLILINPCTDLYNPNVVRSSVGCCFTIPSFQSSLEQTASFLQEHQIPIVAATPHAEGLYFDLSLKEKVAIALGCEQYGLSEELLQIADHQVKIPMQGEADSLNVATAGAIILFETQRQRLKHTR